MKKRILSCRPIVAVTVLAALNGLNIDTALAGEEDSPLSLVFSENISHDTNFSKDDRQKAAETVSTTAAQFGLNKSYGRQTYELGATLSMLRYKNFDQLNNDGRNLNGAFTTGLLRDWTIRANGNYDESLNAIQNNAVADRVVRNIRKYRDGGFSVQYGQDGSRWALAGTYDANRQNYSLDAQKYQDSTQSTRGLRALYFASDVMQYSLGVRHVVTDYPTNPNYSQVVDNNIDLSTIFQLTGLSNLNATLTRRSTTYVPADLQKTQGWTGSLNWDYTPHGILGYNVGFSRTTGSDRQQYTGPQYVNQFVSAYGYGNDTVSTKINNDTVTTSLNLGVRATLTGKLSASAGYSLTQFKVAQTYSVDYKYLLDLSGARGASADSYNHVLGFNVSYAAMRSLSFRCGYQLYSQGADGISHVRYTGKTYDCSANFALNS